MTGSTSTRDSFTTPVPYSVFGMAGMNYVNPLFCQPGLNMVQPNIGLPFVPSVQPNFISSGYVPNGSQSSAQQLPQAHIATNSAQMAQQAPYPIHPNFGTQAIHPGSNFFLSRYLCLHGS